MAEENTENKDSNLSYSLKVLSGPHTGAEVNLSDKALIIGRSETCDIALLDETLNEQHAKIFLQEDKFFCESFENATVIIEGVTIEGPTELKNFQAILCGKTLLSIGPSNEVWPEITLKTVESGVEDQEKLSESKETQKGSHWDLFLLRLKNKIWLLCSCFIIIFIILGVFSISYVRSSKHSEQEKKPFPIVSLKSSIEKVLNEFNLDPNLIKLGLNGKAFTLQCYTDTLENKKALQDKLRALPNVSFQTLRIFAQQSFLAQAKEVLGNLQSVQVLPATRLDTLILKGYLYDMEQLPAIKSRLFNDILGLKALEISLLNQDDVYKLASNLLTQYNLMGLLKIQPMKTGIMVVGNIQATDEPYWKDAQKALKNTFDSICKVLTYVAVVAPSAVKKLFFPSPIIGVSIPHDEPAWIDLEDGERYFEGTLLSSGYILQAITPEGICLRKNEESVFFTLEEL